MSRIRGKNTSPELVVRKLRHRKGYRCRLHVRIRFVARVHHGGRGENGGKHGEESLNRRALRSQISEELKILNRRAQRKQSQQIHLNRRALRSRRTTKGGEEGINRRQ